MANYRGCRADGRTTTSRSRSRKDDRTSVQLHFSRTRSESVLRLSFGYRARQTFLVHIYIRHPKFRRIAENGDRPLLAAQKYSPIKKIFSSPPLAIPVLQMTFLCIHTQHTVLFRRRGGWGDQGKSRKSNRRPRVQDAGAAEQNSPQKVSVRAGPH